MKTNDIWNSKGLLQRASSLDDQDQDFIIRKALFNSAAMNQITNQFDKDERFEFGKKKHGENMEEDGETTIVDNFHDENCNIKVE